MTNASDSWAEASQDLADDPDASLELVATAGRLLQHVEPCGAQTVATALAPLVSLYGVQDKSEGEWKAFWGFYVDALGDLPLEALRAGIADYVADPKSEFFPKPGPLKALCERRAVPLRMAASRTRKALQIISARERAA